MDKAERVTQKSWTPLLAWAVAAISLGFALQVHDARADSDAMVGLSIALVLTLASVISDGYPPSTRPTLAIALLFSGVFFQLWLLLTATAGFSQLYATLISVIVLVPFVLLIALQKVTWVRRVLLPIFLFGTFLFGVSVIRGTPNPEIDVYLFHQQAFHSLLRGENPHAGTIPNIYGNTQFYGEGVVKDGRVQVGFPYPPLSLLLALPGQLIAGDYRYSLLVALILTGMLLAYARPGLLGPLAALLLLTTPRIFYLIELGWTDLFVVMLLAATVFSAVRTPKLLPWALGLLLAVKQYSILVIPFVVFLLPQPIQWRHYLSVVIKAVALATVLTLPVFLWNVQGFFNDVVWFQVLQPFRLDSLSYPALMVRNGFWFPTWLGFVIAIVIGIVCLRRTPRTPSGFAASVAAVFFVFFAFAKQAFANYYILVIGALCCAIAVWPQKKTAANNRDGPFRSKRAMAHLHLL
jgi:hypothetical protein